MPLNFKPDEERARLDKIWEELEAEQKKEVGIIAKTQAERDALMIERNDLAKKVMHLEGEIFNAPKQPRDAEIDTLASGSRNLNEAIEAMAAELEELRKHEVLWDLDKARIKELETERNIAAQQCSEMCLKIAALVTELEQNKN